MPDPLTDIVALLNPKPSRSKLVEGAGQWRIVRESGGEAFYCAVLEGECLININGQGPQLLVAGDFLLIPAADSFENTNTGASSPTEITMPTVINAGHVRIGSTIGPADLIMNVGHCEFDTPEKQLIVSLLPNEILIKGQRRFIMLLELLLDESRSKRPGREVVLMRLLQLLLVESLRSNDDLSKKAGILKGLQHEKIALALHLIHEKPDFDWKVARLASHCAMSRSSFFAVFNETIGMSPLQYLLFWRMSLAKKALMSSNDKIEQIAFQIGYQSASAFNVAFNKYVGIPPGVFRRQNTIFQSYASSTATSKPHP